MLGLGCEANQIPLMLEAFGSPSEDTFHYTTLQREGGTRKTVDEAVEWFRSVLPRANAIAREPAPASELTVGLQQMVEIATALDRRLDRVCAITWVLSRRG